MITLEIRVRPTCFLFQGIPCDLITGEERRFADPEGNPAEHIACTVEMASTQMKCEFWCMRKIVAKLQSYFVQCLFGNGQMFRYLDEVGIVDEIQMIRDNLRGWAWTRSVLGKKKSARASKAV